MILYNRFLCGDRDIKRRKCGEERRYGVGGNYEKGPQHQQGLATNNMLTSTTITIC
jgi:hypothetical protein